MAVPILIIGESGSGKSTSARNLEPESTFYINVANKSLPFKAAFNPLTVPDATFPLVRLSSAPPPALTPKANINRANKLSVTTEP